MCACHSMGVQVTSVKAPLVTFVSTVFRSKVKVLTEYARRENKDLCFEIFMFMYEYSCINRVGCGIILLKMIASRE